MNIGTQSSFPVATVRQAHMPGNYELYEESENRLGPMICKDCWERFGVQNPDSLSTVWVSAEGRRMVWWLCQGHADEVKGGRERSVEFLKMSRGVLSSPGL